MGVLLLGYVAGLLEEGQVNVRLDVALGSRVAVPVPGPANVAGLVDQPHILDPGHPQPCPNGQRCKPGTNEGHLHLVAQRLSVGHDGVGIGEVIAEAPHRNPLLPTALHEALVPLGAVARSEDLVVFRNLVHCKKSILNGVGAAKICLVDVTSWLDPEIDEMLGGFGAHVPQLGDDPLKLLRRMGTTYDRPSPEGIEREDLAVPGPNGAPDIPIRVVRATEGPSPAPAILWFHGGGYVMGGHELETRRLERLVRSTGCTAIAVGYRLSPETPFPGPLDDCFAVLSHIVANAAFQVDPDRIAVGGESAGGGLAAGVALLARERGVRLVHQHLLMPMLDDRMTTPSSGWTVPIWSKEIGAFGWRSYLGALHGTGRVPPTAAPARAHDLAGLPPTYLHVGALDLVLHESVDFALRLTAAGVPTELHVFPGAPHGFEELTPKAEVSRRARALSTAALHRHIGTAGGVRAST